MAKSVEWARCDDGIFEGVSVHGHWLIIEHGNGWIIEKPSGFEADFPRCVSAEQAMEYVEAEIRELRRQRAADLRIAQAIERQALARGYERV